NPGSARPLRSRRVAGRSRHGTAPALRAVACLAGRSRHPLSGRNVRRLARGAGRIDRPRPEAASLPPRASRNGRRVGIGAVVRFLVPPDTRSPTVASCRAPRDHAKPRRDRPPAGSVPNQSECKEKAMTSSAVASIHEIAEDTYRINVAMPDLLPGGFSFNQYLVVDDKPLLFHTGPRKLFL